MIATDWKSNKILQLFSFACSQKLVIDFGVKDKRPQAVFYFRSELELDRDVLTDCEQFDQK